MDIYSLIDSINTKMERMINDMEYVTPDKLGLDTRAAYTLSVNEDCIIVDKRNDRTLQYYGGFEYVDKEYRKELGDYVIYLGEDDRVRGHLNRFYGIEEVEEDLD